MIKNVVFDIGGVLMEYNPKTYLDKLGMEPEVKLKVKKMIFGSLKWQQCMNGKLLCNELIQMLSEENEEYKKWIKKIIGKENMLYMMPPKETSIKYFYKLKERGFNVYILSNITKDTYDLFNENYTYIKDANGGIYSCFEGVSKPHNNIFYALLNKYNLNKNQTIFIDDNKNNINAAQKLGIKSILYNDINQVIYDVDNIINKESIYN